MHMSRPRQVTRQNDTQVTVGLRNLYSRVVKEVSWGVEARRKSNDSTFSLIE